MDGFDNLRESDPAAVARYLALRGFLHDQVLARVETLLGEHFLVEPTRRVPGALTCVLRNGFVRPAEGEIWPAVFLTAVNIYPAVCIQIAAERLTALGTAINGPQRLRHRHWEEWWGWETCLADLRPRFFDQPCDEQLDTLVGWYMDRFTWLARNGLLQRKPRGA